MGISSLVIAAAEVRKKEISLRNVGGEESDFLICCDLLRLCKRIFYLAALGVRRGLFMSNHRSARFSLVPFSVYAAVATAFVFIVLLLAGVLPRIP
jgi:hypothetical protein